jgi:uncharacterized membrane protein YoaK (UPF0700 family)
VSRLLLVTLAFVAGFLDTATYVALSGLFVAHVTGNFVLFAAAVMRGITDQDYLKLLSFPVFVLAAMLGTWIYGLLGSPPVRRAIWLLWLEAALIVIAAVMVLIPEIVGTAASATPGSALPAMLLVVAMGIQNALHRLQPQAGPPTTVMTGNVAQFAVAIVDALRLGTPPDSPGVWGKILPPILAFAVGCLLSAAATTWAGLSAVALPAVLLVAVLIAEQRKPAA